MKDTKKKTPTLTPFFVDPTTLKGLRNMKPNTYPAEPLDSEQMVSKALVCEIPKASWCGDFLIDLEDDKDFLEHHFQCQPGSYLWIREPHRLKIKTDATDPNFKEVWVHYDDGQSRKTTLLTDEVKHEDRHMPPIAMHKRSCRFILKVREIGVRWADPDKKTRLVWVVGIERMPDAEYVLEQERRGCLK